MPTSGQPTKNAVVGSFQAQKCEEVNLHDYRTFEEAQAHSQTLIEDVYNVKRLHSLLEYVPPDEFEAKYLMY